MTINDIQSYLEPVVIQLGYELWGCEYLSQGNHSLLRIYIDKENGITIADCERVSKQLSALLDVEDIIQGHYFLEVSSPGIPRPLFAKEHYRRYQGDEVKLKLNKPLKGSRKVKGIIQFVEEESFILQIGEEQHKIPFSQVVKANLIGE